jgi:hypothetical protein
VDLVHDHSLAGPLLAAGRRTPTVVTAHSLADGDLAACYAALGDAIGLVALSAAQRRSAPDLPWIGTVHNGVVVDELPFRAEKDDLALFLGRRAPEKGPAAAIDAAGAAGIPIVLAG